MSLDEQLFRLWKMRVEASLPVDQFLGRIGVMAHPSAGAVQAPCPIHGGHDANFALETATGFWSCYSHKCHERWPRDWVGLYQGVMGTDFWTAVRAVGDLAQVPYPPAPPSTAERLQLERAQNLQWVQATAPFTVTPCAPRDLLPWEWSPARDYVARRTAAEVATALDWGWNLDTGDPEDHLRQRLCFPVYDFTGPLVGYQGRAITDRILPRYLTDFAKEPYWYHAREAVAAARQTGRIILVEGVFDVARLVALGVEDVVSPLGSLVTSLQAQRLVQYCPVDIFVAFDHDAAGDAGARLAAQRFVHQANVWRVVLEVHDPGDLPDRATWDRAIHQARRLDTPVKV